MTVKPNLEVLDSGTGSEGVRSFHEPSGARHSFKPSPNPRAAGACVKCGRGERDDVHNFHPLMHSAAVVAAFERAAKCAREQDFEQAKTHARHGFRLIEEG